MPRISLWRPNKTNDFSYLDRAAQEQFEMGGTGIFVHKYIGPETTDEDGAGELTIQDVLFQENRTRKYTDEVYELRGSYQVQDSDFDLTQFGIFLTGDTLFITFHLSSMVDIMERKLMTGDVLEMPHLIEDYGLDVDADPIKKFYVVQEGNRPAEGFSPTWFPHLWRVKATPLTDSQEYKDIFEKEDGAGSVRETLEAITDANVLDAREDNPTGKRYTGHLEYTGMAHGPPDSTYTQKVFPMTTFPLNAGEGTRVIRTDMHPQTLYEKQGNVWVPIEVNAPTPSPESEMFTASDYINDNSTITNNDGTTFETVQGLSNVIKPKTDV